MFWVRPSPFVRFIFDDFFLCPDCTLRVPSSMGSTLNCIALETWLCVCSIIFHHLTSIDQPFQLHSHCPTCFGVQHDKCYWFHLCVRLSVVIIFSFSKIYSYSDRDAKQKWANGVGGSWGLGLGGIGGQMLTGAVKKSVGRVFG